MLLLLQFLSNQTSPRLNIIYPHANELLLKNAISPVVWILATVGATACNRVLLMSRFGFLEIFLLGCGIMKLIYPLIIFFSACPTGINIFFVFLWFLFGSEFLLAYPTRTEWVTCRQKLRDEPFFGGTDTQHLS